MSASRRSTCRCGCAGLRAPRSLAPFPQKLVVAALGNPRLDRSGRGDRANRRVRQRRCAARRARRRRARQDRVHRPSHAGQPGRHRATASSARRAAQGPTLASQKGAIAIVVRSIGTDHHRNPHTGVMSFADGARPIPAGALTIPDAEQLVRILKRGKPVTMRLRLEEPTIASASRAMSSPTSPGRDPALAPILVGCHLDSWDQAPARSTMPRACAIAAAAAKRIMDAGRPLRTIRIVWFGAEEVGLFGGLDYLARHGKEPHHAHRRKRFRRRPHLEGRQQARRGAPRRSRTIGAALAPLGHRHRRVRRGRRLGHRAAARRAACPGSG